MTTRTYADGHGRWHALVPSSHDSAKVHAHTLLHGSLMEREANSRETRAETSARLNRHLKTWLTEVPSTTPGIRHFVEYLLADPTPSALTVRSTN